MADRQGLRLPEDSQDFRQRFSQWVRLPDKCLADVKHGGAWPPNWLLSLMALAQHYGVPTRLLDWTRSPYIAAYFAALNRAVSARELCVWALSMINEEIQELVVTPGARHLRLVSAPASDNDNLRAQRWVGLVYRHSQRSSALVGQSQQGDLWDAFRDWGIVRARAVVDFLALTPSH